MKMKKKNKNNDHFIHSSQRIERMINKMRKKMIIIRINTKMDNLHSISISIITRIRRMKINRQRERSEKRFQRISKYIYSTPLHFSFFLFFSLNRSSSSSFSPHPLHSKIDLSGKMTD